MPATSKRRDIEADSRIAAVRRFNRFYTQRIGVLREGYAGSRLSLAQSRVLYELQSRDRLTATEIARSLGLDAGYLSRILRDFETRGWLAREVSKRDSRQSFLFLTAKGRKAFAPLERHTNEEVGALIGPLYSDEQRRLVAAMHTVESLLGSQEQTDAPYVLRPPRAGDHGWIVARHGTLYTGEYGWDIQIEALCAEIVAAFVRNFDAKRERCWIAERSGVNVGCVFLVKEDEHTARIRLLLVEAQARGLGIGARLVEECVQFARQSGYRKITLWTHSVLTAARHIYENAGFKLAKEWTHDDFGKMLKAETWDLEL